MNYFIIHGAYGNSKENWFPWLENELKSKGHEVFNFDYPTPAGQSFLEWSKILDSVKEKINSDSIFICHSISCVFLVKYCIINNLKIKKCIFVSGFNNYFFDEKFDSINKDMFCDDVNRFSELCEQRFCLFSNNDPYVKFDALKQFCNSINANEIFYENAGHFNKDAGYIEFNDLFKYL